MLSIKKSFSIIGTVAIFTTGIIPQALATTTTPIHPVQAQSISNINQQAEALITKQRSIDPVGMQQKVSKLRASEALMELLQSSDTVATNKYLEFFAAISTNAQVDKFIQNTAGKRIIIPTNAVIGSQIDLVDRPLFENPGMTPQDLPRCPKAWAAAIAYFAGSEMICIPTGILGGPFAGIICNGIFFGAGMIPNFNSKC